MRDLRTELHTKRGVVRAVDGVDFDLHRGETLGIVGESGSGKSMTALSIMRLLPPSGRITNGRVELHGDDLVDKTEKEMQQVRGGRIAMILQDPLTSLNPVFRVDDQVGESVRLHDRPGVNVKERVLDLLRRVHIPDAEAASRYFPHQLSGGMRQRVVGAIGIAPKPEILIADEPTSALDPTIQAQYLDLLQDLQKEFNLAILFITHDFGVVANVCDTVAVMYSGRIVEYGPVAEVFAGPAHPYSEALLKSVTSIEEKPDRLPSIEGQPPSPFDLLPGCHFAPRCPYAFDRCEKEYPAEFAVGERRMAKCWRAEERAA